MPFGCLGQTHFYVICLGNIQTKSLLDEIYSSFIRGSGYGG